MPTTKKKILIIEDEERMGELLGKAFSRLGLTILHAKNGDEGLGVAMRERPDLILLDVMLPGMDGLSVLHTLRKNEWGIDTPVILLTNLQPDEHMIQEMARDQPLSYLIKANTSVEEMIAKIKTTIGV